MFLVFNKMILDNVISAFDVGNMECVIVFFVLNFKIFDGIFILFNFFERKKKC